MKQNLNSILLFSQSIAQLLGSVSPAVKFLSVVLFVSGIVGCGSHESTSVGFTQNSGSSDGLKAGTLDGQIKTSMDTGDFALFTNLMASGQDVNTRLPDTGGATLLIYSSLKNLPKFTYYLLAQNADPYLTNEEGQTAFAVAEAVGNRTRILMLLDPERQKAAQVEVMDAVKRKKVPTIDSLLKAGLDPNFIDEETGETPLTRAITVNKATHVVEFIAKWGDPELGISATDINFPNREGLTPLAYAISLNKEDIVTVLRSLNARETL